MMELAPAPPWLRGGKRGAASGAAGPSDPKRKCEGIVVAEAIENVTKRKGKKGAPEGDKRIALLEEVVQVLLKGFLMNSGNVRDLLGSSYKHVSLPKECQVVKEVKEATKRWHEDRKKEIEDHKNDQDFISEMPPPYLTAFATLIASLSKSDATTETVKKTLVWFFNEWIATKPLVDLKRVVTHCKIKDMWAGSAKKKKDPRTKLTYSMAAKASSMGPMSEGTTDVLMPLEDAVELAIEENQGTMLVGSPPRGALERKAQEMLDRHFSSAEGR